MYMYIVYAVFSSQLIIVSMITSHDRLSASAGNKDFYLQVLYVKIFKPVE